MSGWAEDQDPYEVLELTQGHESTEAQIKKAYRLLALKKHPDKQPNNPNAAAEFHPIQRAFDLLSDAQARAALNDLYRAKAARKAREAGQSEKRRKMREDLDKREGAWQTSRSDEQRARNKLKEELDRLRKKELERRANHAAEVSLAFAQATAQPQQQQQQADAFASAAEYQPAAPPQITEELLRTLKVTWDKQGSSYSVNELKEIMGRHGPIEDIVLTESKKKRKGSALVVMQTLDSARAAAEAVNGSLANPLLVVPLAKAAVPSTADTKAAQAQSRASPESYAPAQQPPQPTPTFPLNHSATPPTPPSSPMKSVPVRNPFGTSIATDQTAAATSSQFPTFGAAPPDPAAAAAPPRPLFAAGASMSVNTAGHSPAGPFGFSAGSYSSFPGAAIGAGGQPQPGFGQNPFAHTVQAGVKRAFEDATLMKLKQAADRARAIQQLQTQDTDQ